MMKENPKYEEGQKKLDFTCTPPVAEGFLAQVHANGAVKYGRFNWRETGVDQRTYVSAIRRHLADYVEDRRIDDDSGLPHLAHIMASCAILLDAEERGCLVGNITTTEVKKVPEQGKPSNVAVHN